MCSNSAGWSAKINFKTPPSGGSEELKFLAFGDMGKAPRDASVEHYIQVKCHLECNNIIFCIILPVSNIIMIFIAWIISCCSSHG